MKEILNRPILNKSSGFTIMEVMIAMAIFSIGFLAVMNLQYVNTGKVASSNMVTQETMLAQLIIERLKSNIDPTSLTSGNLANVDQFGAPGGGYNADWSIANPIGGSQSRFITVNISRTGGLGGHPITIRALTQGSGI